MQVPHPTPNPPIFFGSKSGEVPNMFGCDRVILNMCFQFNTNKNPHPFLIFESTAILQLQLGVFGFLPSDESPRVVAGLTYLARCCQKLQHLTLLGGSSSAASSLLLQVQKRGTDSSGRLPPYQLEMVWGIIFGIHLAIWNRHEGES